MNSRRECNGDQAQLRGGAVLPAAENDGLHWPRRDGLKWPHLASVVVGVDVA